MKKVLSVFVAALSGLSCMSGFARENRGADEAFNVDSFRNPPAAYRPLAVWSWNEILLPSEMRRQAELLQRGGFGGATVRRGEGLATPYAGADWHKAFYAARDKFAELGMVFADQTHESAESASGRLVAVKDGENPPPLASAKLESAAGLNIYVVKGKRGDALPANYVAEFEKRYSYNPVPHFYKLFADAPGAERFRLHWARAMEDIAEKSSADAQIPQSERIVAADKIFAENIAVKQRAGTAGQTGLRRVPSRIYGAANMDSSLEAAKLAALKQIALGANWLQPQAALYSIAGGRKDSGTPNIFYQQPWWPLNDSLYAPLSRICYAMSVGRNKADVLVVNPKESVWAAAKRSVGRNAEFDSEALKSVSETERVLGEVVEALASSQITFDLGDERIIQRNSKVTDAKFCIGNAEYDIVILPQMRTMRPSTFAALKEFKDNGGTVLRTSAPVENLDGEKSAELKAWAASLAFIEPERLGAFMQNETTPQVALRPIKNGSAKSVSVNIRELADGARFVLISNLSESDKFEGHAVFGGGYTRAQKYDIESGEISDMFGGVRNGGLVVPLELAECGAVLLRIDNGTSIVREPKKLHTISETELNEWIAERIDFNALILDRAFYSVDGGRYISESAARVGEIQDKLDAGKYEGALSLRYPFRAENFDSKRKLYLVAEHPERVEIRVNGQLVKYGKGDAWKDFRWLPIDISGMLVNGENNIELFYRKFGHGGAGASNSVARGGTELAPLYIVGDFSLDAEYADAAISPSRPSKKSMRKTHAVSGDSIVLKSPQKIKMGDVGAQGMPFYSGRIMYTATLGGLKVPEGARLVLEFEKLDCAAAEIIVNGARAGVIISPPYEADITDFAKSGTACIQIVCYGDLNNLALQAQPSAEGKADADSYTVTSFGNIGKARLATKVEK